MDEVFPTWAPVGILSLTLPPGRAAWEGSSFFFIIFLFFNFIEVEWIYTVGFISAVQQSDSVLHVYILFHILSHYGLSQDIEYSSLGYTVGPCCLSILYIIVCIC